MLTGTVRRVVWSDGEHGFQPERVEIDIEQQVNKDQDIYRYHLTLDAALAEAAKVV